MYSEIYSQFGLTKNQEKILSLILSKGTVDTTTITKGVGISRPNSYDILNKLIEKGLISRFKQNNKTLYKANKINLKDILDEKNQELKNLRKSVEVFNKTLSEKKKDEYYDVEVFSGKNGLSNFIFTILNNKTLYVFGAEGIFEKKFPYIFTRWISKIKENNIKIKAIYNETFRVTREKEIYESVVSRYTERKFDSKTTTIITNNSISLIHWRDNPLIVHIRDRGIAIDYKSEFSNLWKIAKS